VLKLLHNIKNPTSLCVTEVPLESKLANQLQLICHTAIAIILSYAYVHIL